MLEARITTNRQDFSRLLRAVKADSVPHEFNRATAQVYVETTAARLRELREHLEQGGIPHTVYVHASDGIPTGWDVVETSCD